MRDHRGELKRVFAVAVVLALVALTARVLLVLFAGLLFAVVLRALARPAAEKTHVPYPLALTVIVLVLLGGTLGTFAAFLPRVADELRKLPELLPAALDRVGNTLHLGSLTQSGAAKNAATITPEKLFSGAIVTAGATFDALAALIVTFFIGVYGAADPGVYARVVVAVVPAPHKPKARRALEEASAQLERWLLGRLVAMAFVGVTCGIAFAVLGVPLSLPLALLAGVLTFVEYVGAIASAVPAILLGFTQGAATAVWVGVLFTALHVIEGYVLTPMLAKSTVHIPPAYGLATQVILSTLVGPLGLTFSTPLLVVAVVIYQELAPREQKDPAPAPA